MDAPRSHWWSREVLWSIIEPLINILNPFFLRTPLCGWECGEIELHSAGERAGWHPFGNTCLCLRQSSGTDSPLPSSSPSLNTPPELPGRRSREEIQPVVYEKTCFFPQMTGLVVAMDNLGNTLISCWELDEMKYHCHIGPFKIQ